VTAPTNPARRRRRAEEARVLHFLWTFSASIQASAAGCRGAEGVSSSPPVPRVVAGCPSAEPAVEAETSTTHSRVSAADQGMDKRSAEAFRTRRPEADSLAGDEGRRPGRRYRH